MRIMLALALCWPCLATTSILQNSGCNNNTNQLTAVLASNVTANHTLDFAVVLTQVNGTAIGSVTGVTDNDPTASNTYTQLGTFTIGTGQVAYVYSAIAARTLAAPLTITAATTGVIGAKGTCAIEWSDKFKLTLETTATNITYASAATNVGCTVTGTAPNTTVTPAVTGDIVLAIAMGTTNGGGRLEHDKSGTDITNAMVGGAGGSGDNVGGANFAGWGLSYIINTTASTAYTVGFTLVPNTNGNGGRCSTMIRALNVGGVTAVSRRRMGMIQ